MKLSFNLDGFQPYHTKVFILNIPEQNDVLLRIPWLVDNNPDIDWQHKQVVPRSQATTLTFCPCVPRIPAKRVGGRRVSVPQSSVNDEEALTQYYIRHGYQSKQGNTRLVRASQLKRLLRESDNEFCFFVNPTDEPTTAEQA
ncbi:hypothetical protein PHMEG_00030347 [Phytophthora megakarya]|uniref:Uncharacterized protein n=1 Tax=Phytophthora megakarya TaxID=4795 RepID=A0A225V230_9STRA|nr:hypothetical protein PHMEG_00030347 [Phytophthora megakarya]